MKQDEDQHDAKYIHFPEGYKIHLSKILPVNPVILSKFFQLPNLGSFTLPSWGSAFPGRHVKRHSGQPLN